MATFSTPKGTKVFYNLDGHDQLAADVTDKFVNVESFGGVTVTTEALTGYDLELDVEIAAPGKIVVSDLELQINLMADDTATYALWSDAQMTKKTPTLLVETPNGGKRLLNVIITSVGEPIEAGSIQRMSLGFKVSGQPKRVV